MRCLRLMVSPTLYGEPMTATLGTVKMILSSVLCYTYPVPSSRKSNHYEGAKRYRLSGLELTALRLQCVGMVYHGGLSMRRQARGIINSGLAFCPPPRRASWVKILRDQGSMRL